MGFKGFTMAEILLSLTIIGVVAAITLPSLTGNINERTWNTQRKALYARMSQAISLMPALNGYGTLKEESSAGANDAIDTAAETFITSGLSKVLKINNICDNEHLGDCGISNKITDLTGNIISNVHTDLNHLVGFNFMFNGTDAGVTYTQIDTKAAAFETANGESVLAYYNPKCKPDLNKRISGQRDWIQEKVCANFVYDLNGIKGPNTVGKDIGAITVFYPTDSHVVAPMPATKESLIPHGSWMYSTCKKNHGKEYRPPNKEEAASMFTNRKLFGMAESANTTTWATTTRYYSPTLGMRYWAVAVRWGWYEFQPESAPMMLRCIQR